MSTLKIIPAFSSAEPMDFVSTDEAELASHMKSCASARGRLFGLGSAMQSTHSLLTPRIVTVGSLLACAGLLLFA